MQDKQLEAATVARGQVGDAGEHRIADAVGKRKLGLGHDLADEERVAAGPSVYLRRVSLLAAEELGHGRRAERGQLKATGSGGGHEVAEGGRQWMVRGEVVAVRHREQQR